MKWNETRHNRCAILLRVARSFNVIPQQRRRASLLSMSQLYPRSNSYRHTGFVVAVLTRRWEVWTEKSSETVLSSNFSNTEVNLWVRHLSELLHVMWSLEVSENAVPASRREVNDKVEKVCIFYWPISNSAIRQLFPAWICVASLTSEILWQRRCNRYD